MLEIEIYAHQGANVSYPITIRNTGTNTAVNVTNWSFLSRMKTSFIAANITANLTVTTVDAANGRVNLELSASDTANINAGHYAFDTLATNTVSNFTSVVARGQIIVNPGITLR